MNKNEKELVVKCFGEAVLQVRESAGMTMEELSRRTGINMTLLWSIENGTVTGEDFGLSEICKIAKATGLKPNDLMGIHEAFVKKAETE
jgi:transcriptional regulator with XRE-family HTH domain